MPAAMQRLRDLVERLRVIRASDLRKHGIHHQILKRAVDRRFLTKIDRGLYIVSDRPVDFDRQLILACKRVPHAVVCLRSALQFHGILSLDTEAIWMAIDRKARKPVVNGLRLHLVRFSGRALTQGVINTRIDGVPIRVYSAAKTVADCLKYRKKIGTNIALLALQESLRQNKCSCERLKHFARICHVERLVRPRFPLLSSIQVHKIVRNGSPG
jgi:predicted transcriptional regulator of viral defense system